MPFVTVVTLGAASAASELISAVVKKDDEPKSKLMGIRELSDENEEEFTVQTRVIATNQSSKPGKNGKKESKLGRVSGKLSSSTLSLSFNFGNLAHSKRKSVSFMDLRSAGGFHLSTGQKNGSVVGGAKGKSRNKLLALIDLSPTNSTSSAESGYGSPDGDDSGSCRSSSSSCSNYSCIASSSPPQEAPPQVGEQVEEEEPDEEENDEFSEPSPISQIVHSTRKKALSHSDLTEPESISRRRQEPDTCSLAGIIPITSQNHTSTTIITSSTSSTAINGIIPDSDCSSNNISSIRFIPYEDDYCPQVVQVNRSTSSTTLSSSGPPNCYTSTVNISSPAPSTNNFSSLVNYPSPPVGPVQSGPSSQGSSYPAPLFVPHHSGKSSMSLGGTVQGKTNIWKTWIRNKLNLNRNGKYSLEGSMRSLGHFNIKANKSLLVDCTPETEYSTKKLYVIRRLANESGEFDTSSCNSSSSNEDISDDLEDTHNLFVRECLRTYSTPFLELASPLDDDEDEDLRLIKQKLEQRSSFIGRRLHENGIIHSTSTLNVPSELSSILPPPPHLSSSSSTSILNDYSTESTNGRDNPENGLPEQVIISPTKAPGWFWNVSCQSRGIELDEAGIALEGRLGVNYKDECFGDHYIQVKWDDGDERFHFIAWDSEAGRDFICKVDLGEADPIWFGDNKLGINESLIVHSEQRRGLLRDLYTVCVELGCYDKSAGLASADNVLRARNLVQLFQRVDALGFIQNRRMWTKRRIKMDLSHELNSNHRSKPDLSTKSLSVPSAAICTIGGGPLTTSMKAKPIRCVTSMFTMRVECVDFRLRTECGAPVEPYYLSLALYDVKNGKKISEDFHTTVNMDGHIVGSAGGQFRVSETNDQIYAVLRVEKTLQAADWDTYLRTNPEGKVGTRISKSVAASPLFTTEQRYRMPLCWSCRCLFKKSIAGVSDFVLDADTVFTPFYKHEKSTEEEMLKLLADMKKSEKVAKLTIVPGSARVVIDPMKPEVMAVMETKDNSSIPNVIEFPINSVDNFSKFLHLLYVYPISLNLNHVAGKIRARNILCRVFLRTEDDIDASPLEQHPTGGSIATYVLHHRSNPDWYTEIKLSLPVALDPRLHILFQFFHISCSFDNKNKSKPVENIVGYSWIPLLSKYRFIGGEHVLPVAATLPSGYLQIQPLGLGRGTQGEDEVDKSASPLGQGGLPQLLNITRKKRQTLVQPQYSGPDIHWLDKCTLSVKLNLISTIWTKCGCLGAFFAHSEKYLHTKNGQIGPGKLHCDDETTIKTIRNLENMDLATLRDFYPTILNQVCNIASISRTVSTAALKFLIFSFHTLIESGLESVIEQYVRLRFLSSVHQENGMKPSKISNAKPMSEVLIDSWIDLFETGDGSQIASSLEHSRSLFSMIVKSYAVQGVNMTMPVEDSKLVKLMQLFTSEVVQRVQSDHDISQRANENLVLFITTLLSIVPERHIVFAVINAYLACFGPGDSHKLQDFKFFLLQKLVEHPLFLELNDASGDDDYTRLDTIPWARRHFLVATVMKQCRSGLGETSNVRCLALKPIVLGLARHEAAGSNSTMWVPWLRVVCDNLHRISSMNVATHASRCSSVSTVLSSTSSTLVHAALSKSISGHTHDGHNHGACTHNHSRENSGIFPAPMQHLLHGPESARSSTLSLAVTNGGVGAGGTGLNGSASQNCSMVSLNQVGVNGHGSNGTPQENGGSPGSDRNSVDRMSFGSMSNCDYLDAISAIKMSNPNASIAPSTTSCGSGTETIVNENISNDSADGQSILTKEPSDEGEDTMSCKPSQSGATTDVDKSNVVLRRYDKLNEMETSQLLVSGLYLLKNMGKDGLKVFWSKSTPRERASLLQMVHLACIHFTNARKNSTITRKKIVGIAAPPPTMPPSPRTSLLPNKKWSSLPSKTGEGETLDLIGKEKDGMRKGSTAAPLDTTSDWKTLSTEATFTSVNTLSHLMSVCRGETNEMRDVIRTTLDVAKTSEDTRAMLDALENLFQVDELASIVFAKGNEDLSYQLFCSLLNGFGTSYLVNACVLILAKLFLQDPMRTTTQSLLAISSLQLSRVFIHNFRKSLQVLERNLSINDRSSFVMSITENLSFIDVSEFDAQASSTPRINGVLNGNTSFLHPSTTPSTTKLTVGGPSLRPKLSRTLSSAVDLSTRLSTIINSNWLLKSCHNDYKYSELYLKLANYYSHFARGKLRIDAFDSLKDEHESKKRYTEALMCELHVAARLARHTATPEVKRIMLGVSNNLKDEFEEVDEWPEEEDNTEELIQRLESCVSLCLKAERYELMLEVYRILVDIQESLSDYAALEHSYGQMSKACSLIQNKRERFLATYYRVAVYKPKKNGELNRPVQIYVYKEPNVTSLTEICAKVEAAESAMIFSGDVEQMPDDDNIYATITHVSPLPSESPRRKLWSEDFRRHQNIQRFSFDTPFAMKSHDKISVDNKAAVHQQWKRRTTVKTEYTFPTVVNRLRVVEALEEDLSPIVVAIDDMQRRVTELRSELHSQDIKRIQLRLQGSVSVQVNQGPLAYARAFFERESEYPTHDMNRLKAIFRDFVECCGELLIKNKSLIQAEQIDYHAQLDSDYTRLCQVLSPFIGLPEQAMNRMSRISISSY